MKKIFLLFVVTLMVATISNAQTNTTTLKKEIKMDKKDGNRTAKKQDRKALKKLEGSEVTYQSTQAFESDFNNITPISSRRHDYFDEFKFTQNGQTKTAFYDNDSQLVGTMETKNFTDLPSKAREEINKQYAEYTPVRVFFFNDNKQNETDMVAYNIQFNDEDSYFVELNKGNKNIVLQVKMDGQFILFKDLN